MTDTHSMSRESFEGTQKPVQRDSFDVTEDASIAQEANIVESVFNRTVARSRRAGVLVLLAIGLVISIVAIAGNGVSNSLANTGKNVADSPLCPPAFKFLTEIHTPKLYCYNELRYATGEVATDPGNWCIQDQSLEGKSKYNTCSEFYDNPADFQCPAAFKFLTEIHKPKLYCYSELRYATGEESTDPSNWCRRDSKFEGKSQYNTCSEFPYMAPAPARCSDDFADDTCAAVDGYEAYKTAFRMGFACAVDPCTAAECCTAAGSDGGPAFVKPACMHALCAVLFVYLGCL